MEYLKYLTFSYDDGVTQDIRLAEILNRYSLKCTFNLNSGLLGRDGELVREGQRVSHVKVKPDEVKDIYAGHEVAAHTLTHPLLPSLSDEQVTEQVEKDRLALSTLCGYEVKGMAYPCGGENNDERVASIVKNTTGVRYARTITSSFSFDFPQNLYRLNPTVYHLVERERLEALTEAFINAEPDKPMLFYIWGHSYEFDINDTWDWFEEYCSRIAGKSDIFYGTNSQVLGIK